MQKTTDRGYGHQHQQARATYQPQIDNGNGYCTEPICLMPTRWIPPGTAWDLAHGDTKDTYRGPAHPRCNRSEGARRGNRGRHRSSRRWIL